MNIVLLDERQTQNDIWNITADEKNLKERIKIAIEQFSNGL